MKVLDYLNQGKVWVSAEDGLVQIAEMTPTHRAYAARWLYQNAVPLISIVESGLDRNQEGYTTTVTLSQTLSLIAQNPRHWIRSTALYRALDTRAPETGDNPG